MSARPGRPDPAQNGGGGGVPWAGPHGPTGPWVGPWAKPPFGPGPAGWARPAFFCYCILYIVCRILYIVYHLLHIVYYILYIVCFI